MSTPKCIGCPFRRDCPDCQWSGENPTTATVSDARTGVACGKIGSKHRRSPHCPTVTAITEALEER